MKSDFRRYRKLRKAAVAVLAAVAIAWLGLFWIPMSDPAGFIMAAMVAIIFLGMLALVLFYMANDCLICPRCGKLVVKEIRKTWDREDCERRRKILRGEKITCCQCGAEVDTGDPA